MYPYEAAGEKCKFVKSEAVVYINGSVSISKDENGEFLWQILHCTCTYGKLQFYWQLIKLQSVILADKMSIALFVWPSFPYLQL